jgi:hypothetical protein
MLVLFFMAVYDSVPKFYCLGAIEVLSSESESVSRSFSVFFVLEEVLVLGKVDEMEEVVIYAVSDDLVAPDLASLFVPCEEAIMMLSTDSESLERSFSELFVLGEVLFWGNICFVFGKYFNRASVSPLSYRLPGLEETVEADESIRDRASSSLLPVVDFKMLEDSFFLLGKKVRVAVLDW